MLKTIFWDVEKRETEGMVCASKSVFVPPPNCRNLVVFRLWSLEQSRPADYIEDAK